MKRKHSLLLASYLGVASALGATNFPQARTRFQKPLVKMPKPRKKKTEYRACERRMAQRARLTKHQATSMGWIS